MSKFYFVKANISDQYSVYEVLFAVKKSQEEAFDFMVGYNKKVETWKRVNKALLKRRGKLYGKLNSDLSRYERANLSYEVNKIDIEVEKSLKEKKSIQRVYSINAGCIVPFKFDLYDSRAYIQKFDDKSPMEL